MSKRESRKKKSFNFAEVLDKAEKLSLRAKLPSVIVSGLRRAKLWLRKSEDWKVRDYVSVEDPRYEILDKLPDLVKVRDAREKLNLDSKLLWLTAKENRIRREAHARNGSLYYNSELRELVKNLNRGAWTSTTRRGYLPLEEAKREY